MPDHPQIQPSDDAQATAFAIAYALWAGLPEGEQGETAKDKARTLGELADIIIKRGVVSIRRT